MPSSAKFTLLRTLLVFGTLLTLCLSTIFLSPFDGIQHLTAKSTDLILKTSKPFPSEIGIVIVEIDEASLLKYGQWPWPRDLIARLLKTIQEAGAASIGIDIIFPERDRSSPRNRQELLTESFDYLPDRPNIPADPSDHDLILAERLASGPFVLGYEFLFGNRQGGVTSECPIPPVTLSPATLVGRQAPVASFFHQANGILCNYKPLTNAAPAAGFLNGAPDNDGILRRLPLLIQYGDQLFPSFALAILMQFHGLHKLGFDGDDHHLGRLTLADRHVPLDHLGNIIIGPASPIHPLRISAADLLTNTLDSNLLRQKIILVGSNAQGLSQGYPTPYSSAETLLNLHAAAIRALDGKIQISRPMVLSLYEIGASFLFCLVLALLTCRWSTLWSVVFCLIAILTNWIGAQSLFQYTGLLFSPLLPSVTLFLNGLLFITLKFRYFQLQATSEKSDALLLLKASESNLSSILRTIPDIIFRLDTSGNIVFISPAICKYTKDPEPLLGNSIFSYVAPIDLAKTLFRLNERRTGGRATVDLEIRLLFTAEKHLDEKDYRYFNVCAEGLYKSALPTDKDFLGTQGILKDITDRKKLETQLLQAQKMEVIGNLAAGIAHDLNNILSGLVSYPDLLLLEIPKENPLHGKISIIQKSGRKAAEIVQDLLSLARRNISIAGISNVNQIIYDYFESAEFGQLQTRYPNIIVDTDLDHDLANIKGSAVHLSKVVMNLLHNGMEAMPAGGRILISTRNISLNSSLDGYEPIPAGEYVCISVTDNGTGISNADLPRIFEPFFTRKAMNKSGTGLGMTIIWTTVKDHHGYLDIRSREGEGTTLAIYLPATAENLNLQKNRAALEDYLGSGNILIVDDVAEQRQITANMLSKIGYTVHTAKSGEEAVIMVEKQPVDLVIFDMIMPGGIDGLETFKEIIRISPKQKAIITSGYSKSARVEEMLKLGADSFVPKPFTMEQLGIAVKTALTKPTGENTEAGDTRESSFRG
ncbi:MAG: CHASE2 domain-containing protein [Pseudomonadota bacterium]